MNTYIKRPAKENLIARSGSARPSSGAGGAGGAGAGPRGITVRLTFLRILILLAVLVMLLIWVFFIGVLVGRGEKPEDNLPEIARIMPSEKGMALNGTEEASDVPAAEPNSGPVKPKVLKAENLDFMDTLKTKPSQEDLTKAPLPTNIPAKNKKKPENDKASVSKDKKKAESDKTALKDKANKDKKTEDKKIVPTDAKVFDYVYQVAASKDAAASEKLKDKISALGLNASVQKDSKGDSALYRIQVAFRGSPDDTNAMKEKLKTVGINSVIMRSKTPVSK